MAAILSHVQCVDVCERNPPDGDIYQVLLILGYDILGINPDNG